MHSIKTNDDLVKWRCPIRKASHLTAHRQFEDSTMSPLVMAFVFSVVDAISIHSTETSKHNKVEEWSSEIDFPLYGESSWSAGKLNQKEVYHWVEDDVVEKYKSNPDGILRLPGGCELTSDQFRKLQEFRRDAEYVQNCYCQEGGVYCRLKKTGQHIYIT